eukprot:COSAG03_NODE_151_length_11504_cov_23.518632_5_plen_166_part_00
MCCWQGSETGALALSRLKAYATAAPPGNFILLDMDETGAGQWQQWHGDWGLPFIWTSLHVFGGNMGIKGNLSEINEIPFAAPPIAPVRPGYDPNTEAVGVGYVRDHSPLSVPGLVYRVLNPKTCDRVLNNPSVPLMIRPLKAWIKILHTTSFYRRQRSNRPTRPT